MSESEPMSVRSLPEVLSQQAERLGPRPGLRYRRDGVWHGISWAEYWRTVRDCALGLFAAGIEPGDRVGLVSENRIEWRLADMGILAAGAVTVSPHATLAAAQILFELADSGATWLFVSGRVPVSVAEIARRLPLKGIVSFDRVSGAASWDSFLASGSYSSRRAQEHFEKLQAQRTRDDLCCLLYTSGTTGTPKGVMLTHGNILFNCEGIQKAHPRPIEGLVLSWLPLSHIFGRTVDHYLNLVQGATVVLAESPESVISNCMELRPHYLAAVPRFYEKVLEATRDPESASSPGRLRAALGGCIEWLTCGGAPLAPAVQAAYEEAGLPLYPGYGLTETSPVISYNGPGHHKSGTVGPALPGVEVRIAADGEILTRGPHVMKGYWNQAAASQEALAGGWFHTGDLGSLDADGYLSITGRKKEIIVLSNGKKVVPSAIEGLLTADQLIDQAMVTGEGKPFLSAVIVPCWSRVFHLLSPGSTLRQLSVAELACRPEVRQMLTERIASRLGEVAPWEQIRRFAIATQPFSVDNGQLTVSLKLRRQAVLDHYAHQLAAATA
jgi:long-chain acyl-CoA synthetase